MLWDQVHVSVRALQPLLPVLAYDALVIMDKATAAGVGPNGRFSAEQVMSACLLLASEQLGAHLQNPLDGHTAPVDADTIGRHFQLPADNIKVTSKAIHAAISLDSTTGVISSHKVLTLLLECLMADQKPQGQQVQWQSACMRIGKNQAVDVCVCGLCLVCYNLCFGRQHPG